MANGLRQSQSGGIGEPPSQLSRHFWPITRRIPASTAKRPSRLHAVVRFCYYVPQLLLLFLGRVLHQDTGELQEPHLAGIVYR